MKTRERAKMRTMRALTPMQLDTLTRIFYGEFYIVRCTLTSKSGGKVETFEFRDQFTAQVITGRVTSLFRRRLIQNSWMNSGRDRATYVTPKGIAELAKHDESTVMLHG